MSLLQAALAWHDAGCTVIPAKADGSKAPAVTWGDIEAVTPADLRRWFRGTTHAGLGLVCGEPSGRLEMLEAEGRAVTEGYVGRLRDLMTDHDAAELWDKVSTGYAEITPSGGIHWLYRVDGECRGNLKLARRPGREGGVEVLLETRGAGGFVIVAPSAGTTHPSGQAWLTYQGSPAGIPTISPDERDLLHAVCRLLDEMPAPVAPERTPAGPRPDGALRPGDDFNHRASWDDILTPHGWVKVYRMGDGWAWRRPGKKAGEGISATTGTRAGDNLYVWSTSTVFDSETPYSKFGAYALLEHGGDHAAAARELGRRGYGTPAQGPGPANPADPFGTGIPAPQPAQEQPAAPLTEAQQEALERREHLKRRLKDGGSFLFDMPPNPEPVWGEGTEVLWSKGEPCIVTGPIGAGKTTMLGHLVHASLGLSKTVLDYPVEETERVLYLASDRPRQIARNLRRMFDPADRELIAGRLIVWQGPPEGDIAQDPRLLLEMAELAGATRVFVDGIKDIARKISDEETGQGVNKAFQLLVAAGIDVVANHHQRKAEGGKGAKKPKSLDDVYGSTWISAGAGTVVLVWANEPGSEAIEVSTIKTAADFVGPLSVIHDTDAGKLEVDPEGVDGERTITKGNVADVLRAARHTSLTAVEVLTKLGHRDDPKEARYKAQRVKKQADRLAAEHDVLVHPPASEGRPITYQWVGA